jgi:hypothetical protein
MFFNDDSETRTLPGPSGPEIINFVMKQKQHIYNIYILNNNIKNHILKFPVFSDIVKLKKH